VSSNGDRAAILTRALHARFVGDRDALTEIYTDDVRAWAPGLAVTSRSDLLTEFDRRDEWFSEFAIEVAALDVSGDYACAEWSVSMTHSGPIALAGGQVVEPTGVRLTVNGVTIAEFRESRICSFRQYWDELSIFDQLGLFASGG